MNWKLPKRLRGIGWPRRSGPMPHSTAPSSNAGPKRPSTTPSLLARSAMHPITTTADLARACERLARHPYVTVDTEFLRETTYYPLLCVAQMASPEEAVVVDTLAPDLDLASFFSLMSNPKVLKVFHAA